MNNPCPECFRSRPESKKLPYVCLCANAIFTTSQEWLVPRKKQRKSDLRESKGVRARDAQQRLEEKHRRLWRALHLHRDCSRDWYESWRNQLVKTSCKCVTHFKELEKSHPIAFDSEQSFFESSVSMHNAVNERLEKPVCSLERANMLWRHKRPATNRTRCVVSVAVGYEMIAIARLTWPIMQAYADRCGADFIGLDNQTEDWWGLEKFRAGHFASQYAETLFLDADCVVQDSAPVIFDEHKESVCIHDDWGKLKNTEWLEIEREKVAKKSGVSIRHSSSCLNSGVVLSRKPASAIWLKPEVDIGTSHCAEQIWVEHQIRCGLQGQSVKCLDARWNWQHWFRDFSEGLERAYIVHFANAPNRLETITRFITR